MQSPQPLPKHRLTALKRRHDRLDTLIQDECAHRADEVRMHRLKAARLALRDQMERISNH